MRLFQDMGRRKAMGRPLVRAIEGKQWKAGETVRQRLAAGRGVEVVRTCLPPGAVVAAHRHWGEQGGFVLSGRLRVRFGRCDEVLGPGDSYVVPAEAEHTLSAFGPVEVIEFFAPPQAGREEEVTP